jgi:DNA-binding transcriptional LysR family regulator
MIDLHTLETFVWVAKLGAFRSAARKLSLTQPAISNRIALLERDLGVTLFERTHQRPSLTPKGKELMTYAEQMLELRDAMRKAANQAVAVRGSLRLGISDTLVHLWFVELVERINAMYPQLALEIEVDISPNLTKSLKSRQIDIAFLVGPVSEPEIKNVPLISYGLAWIASTKLKLPREPIHLQTVAQRPIITYLRNTHPHNVIQDLLANENISHARLYASASVSTMIPMILDGVGIGVIPEAVVSGQLRTGKLRTLSVRNARLPKLNFVAAYSTRPANFVAASVAALAREVAQSIDK